VASPTFISSTVPSAERVIPIRPSAAGAGAWKGAALPDRVGFPVLESFTVETFRPRLHERFVLAGELDVELADMRELGAAAGDRRTPFSLVFKGPETPFVPQGIHKLEHPEMGAFELFLVPIGPGRYEAIFT
jgi:hypothetical protein